MFESEVHCWLYIFKRGMNKYLFEDFYDVFCFFFSLFSEETVVYFHDVVEGCDSFVGFKVGLIFFVSSYVFDDGIAVIEVVSHRILP